jgi:peptidoglycan/xylan/chitin deacetylase (PgdA/CDA1 family)
MIDLFVHNKPQNFWCFAVEIPEAIWQRATKQAKPLLGIDCQTDDIDDILQLVLGEGQFGASHWRLSSLKRLYYTLKPILPRPLIRIMRQNYQPLSKSSFSLDWPVEKRYALFLWEIGRQIMTLTDRTSLTFTPFWPAANHFALVLTHDIETGHGQDFVRQVADLEERLGFRSSFNFVPERYSIDQTLVEELKERGFEVGIHGLKHDGKLFSSRDEFERRSKLINKYLKTFSAVGFRAPLTHRHPEWMQVLDIEYDLSFFDTDPYEPIPGGTMSIWPFFIGNFVELPYTLVQDYTLTSILGETTPKLWLEKIEFIEKYHGMALVNSHPDYLSQKTNWDVYHEFLITMKNRNGYWHALPQEIARWWRGRTINGSLMGGDENSMAKASLNDGELVLDFMAPVQGSRNSRVPISKP